MLATIVGVLVCAPAALGAERYASPTGGGPAATCPASTPCSIQDATGDATVMPGDRVILLDGTYTLSAPVSPSVPITIVPAAGARPRLIATAGSAVQIIGGGVVRGLHIEASDTGGSRVLDLQGPVVGEQLEVVGTGTTGTTALVTNGAVLRDASVWNRDFSTGAAVATGGTGASLRNVTAIASASGGIGVLASADFGDAQTVTLRNVIARGPADGGGIKAESDADPPEPDNIAVTVQTSNYSSVSENEPEGADVGLGSGNQTATPAFANPASGDFHQLSNSLTIDAGSTDSLLGPLDLDGESRIQGSAPDIGADEYTLATQQQNAGDNFPPDTGIRKGPKKKTPKRKTKFEFGGSEPGVRFECRLDAGGRQGSWESCSSPHKVKGLKRKTKYVFAVRAVDAAGNPDPTPADRRWKVIKKK